MQSAWFIHLSRENMLHLNTSPAYSSDAKGLQLCLQIENAIAISVTYTQTSKQNSGML